MTKKLICKNCGKEIKDIEKVIYGSFTFEIDEKGIFQKKELIPQEYYDEYIDRTRIVCDCGNEAEINEQSNQAFGYSMEKFNELFSVEEEEETEKPFIRESVKKYMDKNKIGMAESHLDCWFKEKYASQDMDTIRSLIENEYDNSGLIEELEDKFGEITSDELDYAIDTFVDAVTSRINFSGASSWRDTCDEQRS